MFFYSFISQILHSVPSPAFLYFPLALIPSFYSHQLMAVTSGTCVVPGRAIMETFGEAEQARLMLSVMCVNSTHNFFLFISFFFFFLARASGPCATSSKCFPLLNSWPQSVAKNDRRAKGNWERVGRKLKQTWLIIAGVKNGSDWAERKCESEMFLNVEFFFFLMFILEN